MLVSRLAFVALFGFGLASGPALVSAEENQKNVIDITGVVPTAQEVKEGILPEQSCAEALEYGFRCMGPKPALRFTMSSAYFPVGSADLPGQLKSQLDVFAKVIKSRRDKSLSFDVVGHADASGTDEVNNRLSKARAQAVKSYLVDQGVSPKALETEGEGSKRLVDTRHPFAPRNRRVEIGRAN